MATPNPRSGGRIRPRLRLVGTGVVVGATVGVVSTTLLALYGGTTGFGTRKAFALGALTLGAGVLGWSGSVLMGRGLERLQGRLGGPDEWTEADSRRAMARVIGFGAGMMLGPGLVDAVI